MATQSQNQLGQLKERMFTSSVADRRYAMAWRSPRASEANARTQSQKKVGGGRGTNQADTSAQRRWRREGELPCGPPSPEKSGEGAGDYDTNAEGSRWRDTSRRLVSRPTGSGDR